MSVRILKGDFPVNVDVQSVVIPDTGGARQSTINSMKIVADDLFEDVHTVAEVPLRGLKLSGNGPCLGWRDSKSGYQWLNYEEVIEKYRTLSYGLLHIGMKPGQDTFVGIYAKNCVEWVLLEHACMSQSAVPVPLYDSLGPQACTFILNQIEAETVVCDTVQRAKGILDVQGEIPKLKRIIVIQDVSEDVQKIAKDKNIDIYQFKEVEEIGKKNPGTLQLPKPDYLATICYTSGTTGNPKGVMLTHTNMVSAASGILQSQGSGYLSHTDRYFSYLPLAHMLERESLVIILGAGASIGFSRGDVSLLMEDSQSLRPTMMTVVPRILNKIYDKVQSQTKLSKIKSFMLNMALRAKQAELEKGIIRNDSLWDSLILKPIREILGGSLRLIVIGGAPIRDDVLTFFRCCLGCPIIPAYGQTESTAAMTVSIFGDSSAGTVGPPIPPCMIKLVDVPDMGYLSSNNEGEIYVKGSIVSKGYFRDPERTAETFDENGWLRTGDIGRWSKNGSLAIVDRKKNILKLSQGEYVSPEKVEFAYLVSPCIDQIFVDGDPLQNYVVSVVVPDRTALENFCATEGILVKTEWPEICQNEEVKKLMCRHMHELGLQAGLKGFEQVKGIYIEPEPFSLENGLLTPTMKLQRMEARRRYKDIITSMYENVK